MKYVAELNQTAQDQIREKLVAIGLADDEIEMAMNSKLSDLEDTIDIKF